MDGVPDVIVVGAGHNALVTAFYLAKGGRKPLVLERRPVVGGCAITEEFAPGYRAPTLAHTMGPLRASVAREMDLARRGVEFLRPDPRVIAPSGDGRILALSTDAARTAEAIRPFSGKDATRYAEFAATFARLGGFLEPLLHRTPPSIDSPSKGDLWQLLKTGRRFRALGKKDGFTLLRWGPMPVADIVGEWFESDLVQATIAARAIFGTAMGPWSAGTGAVLLLSAATDPLPGGSSVTVARGPGVLTRAMADAARDAGADIRTGAEVVKILTKGDRVSGVALADGTELEATTVVSGADPRRTFLRLVDPIDLEPGFVTRIRNYRCPGTVAKLNVALGALPAFRGSSGDAGSMLKGRVHIGPGIDYLERAFDASKYGEMSEQPYLDVTFPSAADGSMAPAGRHVMSVHVQFAPFTLRRGTWSDAGATLGTRVLQTLEHYAPGISSLVEHQQVITPADLEETYGLTGGHIYHGEHSLDQFFTMRPTLGWAQYRTPIRGLYLCGSGTHPGNGLTGASGQNAAREILRSRD